MSPEDSSSGSIGLDNLSPEKILDTLNEVDDEKVENEDGRIPDSDDKTEQDKSDKGETDKEEEETETKVEEDELAALEEDLKEPTEEDLELKTPVQRRALLKDYPDIFKKHPGLESTIYRERAYTELLPTIGDAKSALEAVQTLDRFEADLKQGKTTDLMKAVLADDPKGFAHLVDNYMDNLAKVDQNAYLHVLSNTTKDIVEKMVAYGKESNNEDVQNAASILYQFMFNSTKWQPKQKLAVDEVIDSGVNVERQKLERERKEFEDGKYNEHTSKLMTSIDNQVKGTIEKTIDPKDQMTPFVKSKAIEEVQKKASELLKKDSRFQQIVKGLTDKAKSEKFSEVGLNRIKSAYYTKYKAILLPIIKSVKADALRGAAGRIKKDEEVNDTSERANRANQSSRNKDGNQSRDKSKPLPGESYVEFLSR